MSKPKLEAKLVVLKGQEAEDHVLSYLKRMNRPYGAVDVAANLKGAVPKATVQKILTALVEKGELVQKTYGKTTFFVPNQGRVEAMSQEKVKELEEATTHAEEEVNELLMQVKVVNAELARLRAAPSDEALATRIRECVAKRASLKDRLGPLRAGTPKISAQELAMLDAERTRWRAEWARRRKVFREFWALVTDSLSPSQAEELRDELGIELDTQEHDALEGGPPRKKLKR